MAFHRVLSSFLVSTLKYSPGFIYLREKYSGLEVMRAAYSEFIGVIALQNSTKVIFPLELVS
jgi:hypothetical protein